MKSRLLFTLFLDAGLACLLATAASAQTTAFSYQGRLTEGGALANGLYDFRLSAYDATAVGNQVGTTLPFDDVLVTNGLFVLYPDFGGGVLNGQPRWIEVNVRPGASTGAYTTLTPRQPVVATPLANVANTVLSLPAGAVGAAQLAAGAITVDKLAPAVAQGLAPSGALVASFDESAPNLVSNGYVKVPSLFTTVGGWSGIPERNAQTNRYSDVQGTYSLWTGTELFVFARDNPFWDNPFSFRFVGNRFNPATGLWNYLPTDSAPSFMSGALINLVLGGSNIFAFGNVDTAMDNTNSTGGLFDLTNNVWRNIPTNGFTRITRVDQGGFFWTGSEVLAVGNVDEGSEFRGALFSPATNGWRLINTNGNPQVDMNLAIVGWTGTEVFIYGTSRVNLGAGAMAGALYHPGNATWRAATTNNGPRFGGANRTRTLCLWTGVEFIGRVASSDFAVPSRFHAYNPQLDAWRPCSTIGMPALGYDSSHFWTGTEVGMVVQQGMPNPYKVAVYFYHPVSDSWRSSVSDMPAAISSNCFLFDLRRGFGPHWTGSEAVAYLSVSQDGVGPSINVFRPFRFTPPRTLFFYQRP